ncbi:hypothetical protein SUGI_0433470 [Cryptomeria japonica]|uniref:GDSL esterase/lipase At5g22810 n=1 Tax=Cryptomeria japonica TaxID=3369 RepID=UPI002408EFED|nr:GDSL esterase/lipase At5g22810 [Cryptomeria japonica]GLJ22979.1 hypothetical protein SUGI_0433470 [Cryptomeria japonica]
MEGSTASNFVLGFVIFLALAGQLVEAQTQSKKAIASALYVFGDSTIDPGNNNQLNSIAKANFSPYGRDFPDHKATGRFTNGKLATDILSELSGLPDLLPASLDPNFQGEKLLTGASFGSASSGYDDSTSKTLKVLTLGKQLENFRHYRLQLANMTGQGNATKIISEAIFALSTGSNDFINNYYANPLMSKKYTLAQFEDILLQSLRGFVQSIYNEGATRLVIIGLPPFGCCPSQITLHNVLNGSCYEKFNEVATSFNEKTIALTKEMTLSFPALRIAYYDIYAKLYDMIKYPTKYGFKETRKGCCGTGLIEASILCNKGTPTCNDPSKYVFWDSFHPTSEAYNSIAKDLFSEVLMQLNS